MSADLRRKELYNDLDNHIGDLRKESSTIADKKKEVMSLVSKYYEKVTSAVRKNNDEQPFEDVANDEAMETYDDNSHVEEVSEEQEELTEERRPSIFARLLNKIGIERVERYDEDTEVIDLSETEDELENHDAKELLSITKEVIGKLPEKEREEFASTNNYQKLKELNNKHK